MKLITQASAILPFITLCSAQVALFGQLPDCAKSCANNLPPNCHLDVKCICSDKDYINNISCCVATSCTAESDRELTLKVSKQLCDSVQVTIPSAVPTTCAASGASTAGPASSTAASGTSSSPITSAASAMSGSSTASTTTSSSSTSSSASPATAATGAANNQNAGSKIGAVGAAVAALALL